MEYKLKEGMVDNRIVKDSHQEGIERVKQRKDEKGRVGQSGKMGGKIDEAHWKRSGDSLTPRKG